MRVNEAQKKQRDAEIADFKWVLSDSRGQRVIRRILEQTGVFNLSFVTAQPDLTAFREGSRNVGIFINAEILEVSPEKYMEIMKGK